MLNNKTICASQKHCFDKLGIAMAFVWLYYLTFSLFLLAKTNQKVTCPFNSVYQIGDSTSDTGNLIRVPDRGPNLAAASLPYGETFPGKPTGRWSDGRLIIDYIGNLLQHSILNLCFFVFFLISFSFLWSWKFKNLCWYQALDISSK